MGPVKMSQTFRLPLKPLTAGIRGTQVKAKGEKEDTVNCIYLSITVKRKNKIAGETEGENNTEGTEGKEELQTTQRKLIK